MKQIPIFASLEITANFRRGSHKKKIWRSTEQKNRYVRFRFRYRKRFKKEGLTIDEFLFYVVCKHVMFLKDLVQDISTELSATGHRIGCARRPLAALRVTQCEHTDQWTCNPRVSLTSALHGREMISVTPRPLHPPCQLRDSYWWCGRLTEIERRVFECRAVRYPLRRSIYPGSSKRLQCERSSAYFSYVQLFLLNHAKVYKRLV